MSLIDTHTHLYLPEFGDESGAVEAIDRAVEAGVSHLIFPNVDLTTVEPMCSLHARRPDVTSVAMGLHPTEVGEDWHDKLAEIKGEFQRGDKFVAVGEIGIDLYWDRTFAEQQMLVLEEQLRWAADLELPVIIHCREGLPQALEVLQAFPQMRGVMHSFGGSVMDVEAVRRTVDFYFGINGIVTFKNSTLRTVLPAIGVDRMLLETDSPYLAPVPHRGKRNESSYLPYIAAHVADSMGLDINKVALATSANATHLFNI